MFEYHTLAIFFGSKLKSNVKVMEIIKLDQYSKSEHTSK